jgi:CheY-like chemotaxis protein
MIDILFYTVISNNFMTKKPLSVFVIDDDSITRFIHRKVIDSLNQFTIEYNEASNGLDAIRFLENLIIDGRDFPDIILLDINMPVLDGFGFIEEYKKLNAMYKTHTEIIIVSSSEDCRDTKRGYDLGINHFFCKPMTTAKLESAIFNCLNIAA